MRNLKTGLVFGACLMLMGCDYVRPNAGQECVLTQQPFLFGDGGVDQTPVKAGSEIIAWSTKKTCVSMVPATLKEHFDDIMTSDGLPISFDLYGKFQIVDSVGVLRDFGGAADTDDGSGGKAPYWYVANLVGPLRNIARDAVRQHDLKSVAIDQTAQKAIEDQIKLKVRAYLVDMHIPVTLRDLSLGKANPPEGIKKQRVLTAEAEQRQLTEKQVKLAEDARKDAEASRAIADAAYQQRMGLNTEQFVALQAIMMQKEVCTHSACTFVSPGISTSVLVKPQ